ncbi:MAG: hypothetical protein V4633_24385 [Pseudomonadota bacterium]
MNSWFKVALLSFFLTGCASFPQADYALTASKLKGKALVVVSITNNDAMYLVW